MTQINEDKLFRKGGNISAKVLVWNLAAMFLWVFLWLSPWPTWLETNLWLKVGIALVIFIIPGIYLSLLLSGEDIPGIRNIVSGFVLSHLVLALMGLAGRVLHFPFLYIKNAFMILCIFLIALYFLTRNHYQKNNPNIRSLIISGLSYWPLAIIAGLAILLTIQRVITSDDLAYLAHVTNWGQMPALNFSDVYFDTSKIESTRFWIVSAPFSQAFLSVISGVPGLLLLSGYYEPFLAVLSIFCFYDLAKTLKITHSYAIISVAIQVTFLALLSDYLHPGAPFFHQLSTDKATAAFIFVPVFISSAIRMLKKAGKGTTLNFLLSGISLTFMHPIISAYAVFIIGGIAMIGVSRKNFKKNLFVVILAVVSLTPQIGVRFVKHEAQPTIPTLTDNLDQARGVESLITQIEGTPFYGFNPHILEMHIPYTDRLQIDFRFLPWIWLLIPLLAISAAIKGLHNDYLKQYIAASTLLTLLAGIPFTGWILGYFVSAWMLERTTWLYPFGISSAILLKVFIEKTNFEKRITSWRTKIDGNLEIGFATWTQSSVSVVAFILVLLVMREQSLPNLTRLENSTQRYLELISVSQYIDENTLSRVNIVGSDELNDFIPALSWKAKVISYRPEDTTYPYFYTQEKRFERWSDRQAILSRKESPAARMELIKKYNVRYLLIESYRVGFVKDLITAYPETFESQAFGRFLLIEINNVSSTIDS